MPQPHRFFPVAALLAVSGVLHAAGLRSPGVDPDDLYALLASPQPPLVIDVRTPDEYSSGHVPGAVNMPVPTVTRHIEKISQAEKVALYCNDAHLTRMAEQLLMRAKIEGFSHLEGGLTAWQARGLPLETSLPE